jgi:dephospho-CoA kinase
MIIIGVTGTIGSGKGTVVDYLVSKYGFRHYSARQFLGEEVKRRGLPDNRDSIVETAISLRTAHGPDYVADQLYTQAIQNAQNAVIESIRNTEEVVLLRRKPEKFYLLAVDADPLIRFERIQNRKSSTDNIDFDKFLQDEKREMSSDNPNAMNIAECMRQADARIENNEALEELHNQIDKIITPLLQP